MTLDAYRHRNLEDEMTHQLGYKQAADPGAVGAGKVWHDTDDDKVYVRNAADSGWVEITGGAAHPDLATHDALGLATQAELDAHTGDATDAHDASAISISDAAGDFAATDVEGALAELQTADEADEAALAAHLADAADAHDASAISVVSTTLVGTGTDAQAVFEELDNAIVAAEAATAAHLADATAAHAASAVSFTPNGSIAATDVQAAIQEVRDEAAGGAHPDLAAHNTLGLATQAELDAVAAATQPLDTDLSAIAALTSAADRGLQSTGAGTWSLFTLTAAGRALVDDADAAAMRATLGLGYPTVYARKTADEALSSTSLANSTGLGLAVPGAGTYIFEYCILFDTNSVTVGIKLTANGPTVSAVAFGLILATAGNSSGAGGNTGHVAETAWDAQTVAWASGPGAPGGLAVLRGSFVATASGTVNLRHASETATATTIRAGSYGSLTRIA